MGEFKQLGETEVVKRLSFTPKEKIASLERELALRRYVFPKRVESKKITQAFADKEIAIIEAIIADIKATMPSLL